MDNKVMRINELESICEDINSLLKASSQIEGCWNDPVSMEFQKKLNHINNQKIDLIDEIKALENQIKNDSSI